MTALFQLYRVSLPDIPTLGFYEAGPGVTVSDLERVSNELKTAANGVQPMNAPFQVNLNAKCSQCNTYGL